MINYKQFAHELFSKEDAKTKGNDRPQTNNSAKRTKDLYFEKLHTILNQRGGRGLINLCKEFKVYIHI